MWDEAYIQFKNDKILAPLIQKYGPCEIQKRPKNLYFTSLVRAITGQQLSVKAAATIYGRVEELLKREITPEAILKVEDDKFRGAGLSYMKISYVKDLATKALSGELEINKMDDLEDHIVEKELIAVKGIGKWTAEMFLMFTLGRPDIFPVDDLGIRNAFKKLIDDKATNEEMEKYAQRWKPWRTVASWYLWRSLENEPEV